MPNVIPIARAHLSEGEECSILLEESLALLPLWSEYAHRTLMVHSQLLEDFSYAVPLEHSNDKWVAFAWPQRIAQQCEDTEALLKQSRGLFQEEVGAKFPVMKKMSSFSLTRAFEA